jgi:hypothetical protein
MTTQSTPESPTRFADLDINLDQQFALKVPAERRARDFNGIYGGGIIERFLISSYDEFADRATIRTRRCAI